MPYHCEIEIEVDLPERWAAKSCWVKGDMIYALSFERVDLFSLGRDGNGRRSYQTKTVSNDSLRKIQACMLAALGL